MTSLAPWEVAAAETSATSLSRRRALLRSRFAAHTHGRAFWIALWAAAVAAELLALRPVVFDREAPIQGVEVVLTLIGGSFAACGLVAWRRRPDSRSGMLMTATGFLFFVSPLLAQLDGELASTLRVLSFDWWVFPFVTLLLTFLTSGRLQSRFERALVASYALPLVIGQVLWMLFDPEEGHLLLAFPDADVAHAIDRLQRGLLACACGATVIVVVARWWRAAGPRRRALLPSVAGAFGLLCFAALLVNDLVSGTRSQTLLWMAACSLVLVPLAFLAGLLRSRLARSGLAELFLGLGTMRGGDLQAALAKTLGDPGLVVAYWLPDYGSYADATGQSVELPANGGDRAVAPVERDGKPRRSPGLRRVAGRRSRVGRGGHRRGGNRARERAPARRVAGAAHRAEGVARAHRRGRRRGAAAAGAQPPRRRPAAPRRDRAPAASCSRTASATTRRPST